MVVVGLFGGEVKQMKVSSKGGHVLISKTNFLIALAPYFFPLYAFIVIGGVLLILEMLWGRATLVVFAVSFDGMPDFKGSLLALLDPENLGFIVAYLGVGALFAGLIFAVSVVSMPMILDRQTDAITAGLTSLRLVLTQPGVMLWWGALITVLVVAAMLPWFAGLLVVGPDGAGAEQRHRARVGPHQRRQSIYIG